MIPLTKLQTARLLQRLSLIHTPDHIIDAAKTSSYSIRPGLVLACINDIYYLKDVPIIENEHMHHRYVVFVDGVPTYSRDRLFKAAWLVDKLCQLLFTAKEIRIQDTLRGKTVVRWIKLRQIIDGWIAKE